MGMSVPESHSFVVKIWREEVRDPWHDVAWRGSVTHAESRERRYLESLPQVVTFLAPYVQQMGGSLDCATRLLVWWGGRPSAPDDSSPDPPEQAGPH